MSLPVIFAAEEGGGSFLVTPGIGLMIWTLLVFGISMYILAKVAFPASPRRSTSARTRSRSDRDLRAHAHARPTRCSPSTASGSPRRAARPTTSSPAPARPARRTRTRSLAEAKGKREEMMEQTRRRHRGRDAPRHPGDPQGGRRPHGRRHREGHAQDADRRTTRSGSSRRPSPSWTSRRWPPARSGTSPWRRSPRSTPAPCSRSPWSRTSSTRCATSSASSPTPSNESRELQVFLFSPYFSTPEKTEGLDKAISGADETTVNFLQLLIEKHRMPVALPRARGARPAVGGGEQAPARDVTSAVELSEGHGQADRRPDRRADRPQGRPLRRSVDPDILGGIIVRVGNSVLDASIRNRLENFRKQVGEAT